MSIRYDDPSARVDIVHVPDNTGLSVPGTAASATVLLRIPIAGQGRKVNKLRLRLITGGTAAGPTLLVGKSVGGTGTVSQIGTYTFGTSADGAVASQELTSTDFDTDDEVVITNGAGTAASTPAIIFALGYDQEQ